MYLTFIGPKYPKVGDTIEADNCEAFAYTGTRFVVIPGKIQKNDYFILKTSNEILVCTGITPKSKKVISSSRFGYFNIPDCLRISEITHISQEPRCATGYNDSLFKIPQCNNKPERYIFGFPYCKTCAELQLEMHKELSKL